MLFLVIKWIHVLSAITAVGASISYWIWIARASREPKEMAFVLRNIQFIERRLANPCYGLLLITGVVMLFLTPIPLTTPWLLSALVLYVTAALMGVVAYAPAIRNQIQVLELKGFKSPDYPAAAKRSRLIGLLVTADVILIIFLMVVKPVPWG